MTNDVQNNLKQVVSAFQSDVDEILRIALKWDVEPGVLQELGQFLGVPSLEMAGIFLKKAYSFNTKFNKDRSDPCFNSKAEITTNGFDTDVTNS